MRNVIDEYLATPLDPKEADEHKRANWGLSEQAVRDAAVKDRLWGGMTYGEEG